YLQNFNPEDTQLAQAQRKLKQAELGAKFLKRIEDVEIMDSMVVDKKDFLSKLPLSPDLGSLKQTRVKLPDGSETDKIEYITQRGDRTWFSDTVRGQSDLFTSYKLLDRWASAEKQIAINTPGNENYPFLMLDGVTLCFASDGEGSLGGYDIFITRFSTDANKFLPAENVGMPFNSPFNDYMMIVDELRKVGWFVSDRYQPQGKVVLYQFIPNIEKKIIRSENPDTLIRFARAEVISKSAKGKRIKSGNGAGKQIRQPENRIIINDSVTYSDISEFRSPEAREAYQQLQSIQSEFDVAKSELEVLRETYAHSSDENAKMSTAENIMNLEAKLRELRPKIDALTLKWRNDEIKFLQNSLDKK
ncbi:MAG: WD40-like beta Propeller containing protein, partial [Bacteroidetes bacterium]|nr:WD40-like beta Propeller containing protein [Bacteroidota bacterium]